MIGRKRILRFLLAACPLAAVALSPAVAMPCGADGVQHVEDGAPWRAGEVLSEQQVAGMDMARCFRADPVPDAVFARMQGRSYPQGCRVGRASLRYVRLLHWDDSGRVVTGELVCNKQIAADLVRIFHRLYDERYPIHSVRLIDDYGGDDERSMRANNTSCFCYREVKGSRRLSAHALGMAVDLNPLYNPCCRRRRDGSMTVQPSTATAYCDRTARFPYKITRTDLAYRLFTASGFVWGGAWRSVKDYQHFER